MIVNKDINPERDVYYLGAKLIEILNGYSGRQLDFFDTFQKLNEKENISINLYVLVLDWLFLLGLIKKSNKGFIEKCF